MNDLFTFIVDEVRMIRFGVCIGAGDRFSESSVLGDDIVVSIVLPVLRYDSVLPGSRPAIGSPVYIPVEIVASVVVLVVSAHGATMR